MASKKEVQSLHIKRQEPDWNQISYLKYQKLENNEREKRLPASYMGEAGCWQERRFKRGDLYREMEETMERRQSEQKL